ncbi:pola1 [Symbiodinium sp. CCMP2456]|nr:pola1 [Symbiodinium sp. CCMP2456]
MRTTKPMDDELVELVKERQLVLLNTWKSAAPSKCCTFTNNGHRSQIDFLVRLQEAETAASKNDLGAVYRVVNSIAPKRRREKEFEEIYGYFRKAFSSAEPYEMPQVVEPLSFTVEEVQTAIQQLKRGKAVPTASLPADVWLLDANSMAQVCTRIFNRCNLDHNRYPAEATCCELSLLQKAGRAGRRPQDLRPLGLQDPGSKTLAVVLRSRILPYITDYIATRPQYAYCPGKAIDEAISRVARHCKYVRVDARAAYAKQQIDLCFEHDQEGERPDKEADAEEARPPKWAKPEGKGSSQDGWDNWRSKKRNWGAAKDQSWGQARSRSPNVENRHQFCDLRRYFTHSCLAAIRDAVERWQELFIAGKVTMALKTTLFMGMMSKLKKAVEELQVDENKIGRCKEAGWVKEGATALDPAFVYHAWDTKNKQQVEAETQPLPLTTVLKDLDVALRCLSKEGVLLRFRSTQELTENMTGEVVPFMATISLRSKEADDLHQIMQRLAGCACCKLLGMRIKPERGARSNMSKLLEQAYMSQDFCEWKPRRNNRSQGSA